jgi:hypothetical protein
MESHVNVVHKKINPYVCELCGKAYPTKKARRTHYERCHDEKGDEIRKRRNMDQKKRGNVRVVCDLCGAPSTASNLRTHQRSLVRFVLGPSPSFPPACWHRYWYWLFVPIGTFYARLDLFVSNNTLPHGMRVDQFWNTKLKKHLSDSI